VGIVLNALCGQDLLVKKEEKYANAPAASKYLVQGKPFYLGDILKHNANLWERWGKLSEVLKTGKPARGVRRKRSPGETRDFIFGMENLSRCFGDLILPHVNLGGRHSLLDLGGGPGAYAVLFCKHYPALFATVFDLPEVVKFARKHIEEEGLGNRISTLEGDYLRNSIGSAYDAVLASNVIHSLGPKQILRIFKKCFKALDPGGILLVRDFILDEDGTDPPAASLFAVNMLVGTTEGNCYTEAEVTQWLQKTGFVRISFSRISPDSALLTAYKPKRKK
jgi:SAM-dependent methyltransferase